MHNNNNYTVTLKCCPNLLNFSIKNAHINKRIIKKKKQVIKTNNNNKKTQNVSDMKTSWDKLYFR